MSDQAAEPTPRSQNVVMVVGTDGERPVVEGLAAAGTRVARTRRGFLGACVAGGLSALLVGVLWLLSRGRPSAGRDPAFTPPAPR